MAHFIFYFTPLYRLGRVSKAQRNGTMHRRDARTNTRQYQLGNYIIFTDTEKTERNYFAGLYHSIPENLQKHIMIRVFHSKTKNLVDECRERASLEPQYAEPWIVLDRDRVPGFDELVSYAEHEGINIGWSNPCIEVWFHAYFGAMPTYPNSVKCCEGFASEFRKISGKEYQKSDPDIYTKLNRYGDERNAICLAEQKMKQHIRDGNHRPSQMCPCTTLHALIREIRGKIDEHV